jgi:PhnB protein
MELSTHLHFNGQCATAFRFYEQCLGGRIVTLLTHGETPAKDHVAADWQDKVIHARLVVGNKVLMGCDAPEPHYAAPRGMQVSLSVPTPAEAERIFKALAEDGTVTMPFQQTFWSPGFGMAVDRFGIPWMINTEQAA